MVSESIFIDYDLKVRFRLSKKRLSQNRVEMASLFHLLTATLRFIVYITYQPHNHYKQDKTGSDKDRIAETIYIFIDFGVLSKILCKWKQDSVVSLFLYLDSVFKYKHKLVHNQSPV